VSFGSNLYLFDTKNGDIIKASNPVGTTASLSLWISDLPARKPVGVSSIAIDGSIWVLTQDNEIQRYFKGLYEENITPAIFPAFENASQIKTNRQLPYLYVLDAPERRVVLISKSGEIIKQYKSDVFADVVDFEVSQDGSSLYLFDGKKVYIIKTAPFE